MPFRPFPLRPFALLLGLFGVFAGPAKAQESPAALARTAMAYDANDYATAWAQANAALSGQLSPRHRSDAHRYRLLSANRLSMQPGQMPGGLQKATLGDSATASMQWLYRTEADGQSLDDAQQAALAEGYRLVQTLGYDAMGDPSVPAARLRTHAERLDAWSPLYANNYAHFEAIGQLHQVGQQYPQAKKAYADAIRIYNKRLPSRPDASIGRDYYNLAFLTVLYSPEHQDADGHTTQEGLKRGLAQVQDGLALLNSERERGTRMGATLEGFDAAEDDLRRFQLDCFQKLEPTPPEALPAFKAAIAANPDDALLHSAYANLLENTGDVVGARNAYTKATKLDPSNTNNWFNLGVLDFNQAAQLLQEANTLDDMDAARAVQVDALALLRQARRPFENALAGDPQNRSTLQVLLQIATLTDDLEGMKRYQRLLEQ